jgi:peptidyl-prolyl cis-trans isomerase D
MATLEKIRSKAGLLVTAIGIALFAFIIGDLLRSGSTYSRNSKDKIAVVNGQSIGYQEFQNEVENTVNNYKSRNTALSDEQQNQIRQMVFEQMVNTILLDEESKKTGFAVSKEERSDLLIGNNVSPIVQQTFRTQTGAFDKNSLIQFLKQIESDDWTMYSAEEQQQLQKQKDAWLNIEKTVAEQKLFEKFSTILASVIVTNSVDAKAAFNDNAVNVDFNYVSQLYSSIPDAGVEISDAEIAKLYESRKKNFKQEPAKVASYIAVNIVPSEADFAGIAARIGKLKDELATTTRLADLVNENSDTPFLDAYVSVAQLDNQEKNFIEHASVGDIDSPVLTDRTYSMSKLLGVKEAPDSIKVNQVIVSQMDDAKIKPEIDSLIQVIRSGKSFADVASSMSRGQTNGDMGWQTEASLVKGIDVNFANALFDAKVNDVFTVKSSFGIHLVQVVEKTAPVKKYKLATIKMEVTPSQETYNKLYTDLNQFVSKNRQLEQFQSAAEAAGYVCQKNVQLLENQYNIANIGNSRQVIRWANSHSKGNISDIFECQGYFIVAAVEGELKAGFRPLKDVSDILKRELINEKKGANAVQTLKAKNLSSLEDYATAMSSPVQDVKFVTFATPRITGIGVEPIVNVKAVSSEVGQITAPFAGKSAVFVLSLTAKNKSDQTYNEFQQKQQMNMQNSYRVMQMIQGNSILKDKATIEDNRSRFY